MKAAVNVLVKVFNEEDQLVPPDELEGVLDGVMEELQKLDVEDAGIGATLSAGTAEISVTVEAESLPRAFQVGRARIRTAIHASGGHTPDWDSPQDPEALDPDRWSTEVDGYSVRWAGLASV